MLRVERVCAVDMYNNPVSTVGKRVSNIAGAYLGATSSRILKGLAACAPTSPKALCDSLGKTLCVGC